MVQFLKCFMAMQKHCIDFIRNEEPVAQAMCDSYPFFENLFARYQLRAKNRETQIGYSWISMPFWIL